MPVPIDTTHNTQKPLESLAPPTSNEFEVQNGTLWPWTPAFPPPIFLFQSPDSRSMLRSPSVSSQAEILPHGSPIDLEMIKLPPAIFSRVPAQKNPGHRGKANSHGSLRVFKYNRVKRGRDYRSSKYVQTPLSILCAPYSPFFVMVQDPWLTWHQSSLWYQGYQFFQSLMRPAYLCHQALDCYHLPTHVQGEIRYHQSCIYPLAVFMLTLVWNFFIFRQWNRSTLVCVLLVRLAIHSREERPLQLVWTLGRFRW